ncbi:uncharacterized protein LOC113679429 [Pocillopora damicornis]|uniref:uncharacterized protein LOC113679429 n=1 Tax=Pocillopora damicornis TaxID=46731 RepID=UPI000F555332|nr:uncharacterized protein LOC113679429 [Pocillopora damicornis]
MNALPFIYQPDRVLSTLSEAKIEDERKRSLLLDEFRKAQDFLSQLNENRSLPLLRVNITEILEEMKQHISQLEQKEYYILVAGEASAGKSSLINLILGERLLPSSSLSTTSTLCELKYGEERKIVAHLKDTDSKTGLTSTIFLENPTESSGKSYLQQISPFVHVKGADRGKGTIYKKVEIFWPHQLLKKGVTIIDSPGVGESEVMDEVVTEYLPQAFGFIYVINSANAGGVQKDRLVSLLSELGKISRERQEEFPSKCALFVCNKWDQIPEDEADDVKAHIKTKLKEWWPDLIPESQITYISVKNALGAQSRGKIKTDFITLMNGIRIFVLKCIEQRQQTQLIDRIRIDMTAQANEVETKLCEFLNSEDLGTQFIYRFYGSAPSVSELDEELQVILQQWEDKNHVFANAFSLPLQRFLEQHKNSASAIRGHLAAFGLREACAHCNEELQWKDDASAFLGCGMFASVYKGKMRRHGFEQKVAVKDERELSSVGHLAEFGLREACVHCNEELQWKDDPSSILGRGTFAYVYKGKMRRHGCEQKVAVKVCIKPLDVENASLLVKEMTLLRLEEKFYFYARPCITLYLSLFLFKLSEEDSVRIGDVGVSKEASKVSGTVKGSFSYMAPEVFHSKLYDFKADIYSFGIMLWEMWFGRRAFAEVEALNNQHFFSLVDHGRRPKDIMELKKPPRRWKELMERCWDRDPEKRPTADNCEREMTEICSAWTGH